jgi:Mce-associated membrane protein
MSGSNPSNRRRIAGESKPGAPIPPPPPIGEVTRPRMPKAPRLIQPKQPESAPVATAPLSTSVPVSVPAKRAGKGLPPTAGIIAIVVALASLGFAVFGVAQGVSQWRGHSVAEARGEASDAAATAAETIFTFDYNKLSEWSHASKNLMTPKFSREFESNVKALSKVAPAQRIQAKAVVRNAATVECGDRCTPDKATVLVFLDQAVISARSKQPTIDGESVRMFMVKRDGTWLVNGRQRL